MFENRTVWAIAIVLGIIVVIVAYFYFAGV
jgi:hypothetical protein